MRYATLSATKVDGSPNVKKISNVTLLPKNDKGEKQTQLFEVPAEAFSFPQLEDSENWLQDFVNFSGDEKTAKDFINAALEDAAVNRGLVVIRTATSSADGIENNFRDVVLSGINAAKEWTPKAVDRGPSAKEVGAKLKSVWANKDNMTPEQILEAIAGMMGNG